MKNTQILGIGIDIVDINRFKKLHLNKNNPFLKKVFTEEEIDYCFSKKDTALRLSTKFAGKEAVIKAFSGLKKKIRDYKRIEILNNSSGAPQVRLLYDNIDQYKIMISLSNESDKAIAIAILIYG